MKYALCNEVIREMSFAEQCAYCAELGYMGIELAPFTLDDEPHLLSTARRAEVRRTAEAAGIEIVSLHWLLVTPEGLSITDEDAAVRARTVEVLKALIEMCAEVGGKVLVHGSPAQRRLPLSGDQDAARQHGIDSLAALADTAQIAGVTYCIEALAPPEANFITSIAEAAEIVDTIASPAMRTMLDCCAARTESETRAELIDRWLPSGHIAHVQVNDANRRGPGQGDVEFHPVLAALERHGYDGVIAVEPFDYVPDGPGCAARAIGYLRGVEEGLK
jgi:D-psicose/D-tagatose/L-ribulose 3-epimerase